MQTAPQFGFRKMEVKISGLAAFSFLTSLGFAFFSILILDLKDGKLYDSGKQGGKTFHKLHVLGMNDDLWDRVRHFQVSLPTSPTTPVPQYPSNVYCLWTGFRKMSKSLNEVIGTGVKWKS